MKTFKELEMMSQQGLVNVDSKDQLNQMVINRSRIAFKKRDRKKKSIKQLSDLKRHQSWVEISVLKALGDLPYTAGSLNAKIIKEESFEIYTRENIIFESLEKVYVTANLYKPNFTKNDRFPCIILACGHQLLGKHSEEYQFVAQTLVSYGFIVFVIDNFGQGERFSYLNENTPMIEPLTYEHDHAGYQSSLIGDNIAKYMVYDHIRAIDYLETRSDVDMNRLGITGNSGGGTIASLLMILEKRLKAAAPATFITRRDIYQKTGQAQDREQHWFNLSNIGFDHEDLLLAFAPKPLRLLVADYDFFPLEGTLKSFELAKMGYKLYQQEENLSIAQFPIEHSYPVEMAQNVASFFQACFNYDQFHAIELKYDLNCLCTPTGQVASNYQNARFVYDLNLEHFNQISNKSTHDKSKYLHQYLTKIVYQNRNFKEYNSKRINLVKNNNSFKIEQWSFQSQVDMTSSLLWFKPIKQSNSIVLALWPGSSSNLSKHEDFIQKCLSENKDIIVLDLSGEGYLGQRELIWWAKSDEAYGSIYKLNDDLFWLGDSIAALRTYEVIKAIEWIKTQTQLSLEIHAFETHNVYALFAIELLSSLIHYEEHDGFSGYQDWIKQRVFDEKYGREILFPNILKFGDIQDVRINKKESI
jgi:hypothetical protein